MPRPARLPLALCFALSAVAGCAVAQPQTAASLNGSSWRFAELRGQAPAQEATLAFFEPGRAAGTTGCNRFNTGVRDGAAEGIAFTAPATTRMACPEAQMRQEQVVKATLEAVRAARIEEGRLVLLDQAGTVLARLAPLTP